MKTFSEFQIIGYVGQLKEVGGSLRVSIAAEYGKRDDNGDFQSRTFWNEVTVFVEKTANWIRENIEPGDLVHTRGTVRDNNYEKDGRTIYDKTMAAHQFDLLAKKTAQEETE
jgi:single-stranded DNA-binding protein